MARAPRKAPAKVAGGKAAQVRAKIAKVKSARKAPAKASGSVLDKAIDIVKWVDSPFKLIVVIILGALGLIGYIVYTHQDKLMNKLVLHEAMPIMVPDDVIIRSGRALLADVRAEAIIIHEVNLSSNARLTRVAMSQDGRYPSLEGKKGAFFSGSPARNHAAVSMLNGEVMCETFEASSEAGDWLVSRGVTYACRGSIPPEQGAMVGYISVGFKAPPRDVTAVKARINQTARELAR